MKRRKFGFAALAFVVFVSCIFTGCSTDVDDELSLLGEWVEESPVENRTELFFYSGNRVTMTTDSISEDYVYRLGEEAIFLRHDDETVSNETELYFRQINENTFQIGNLHPSIPEQEPTFMIFRRKSSISVEP